MADRRKVGAIYDALDAQNFKQAIKLCDAALKKSSSPLIKALKALSLHKSGRSDEGLALCRDVAANLQEDGADGPVLNTLMMVFKATGNAQEGTACYARAYQLDPTNEELARQLFVGYLRSEAYAEAQQLALRLYKQLGAKRYLLWAVTGLLLQVDELHPPGGPHRSEATGAKPECQRDRCRLSQRRAWAAPRAGQTGGEGGLACDGVPPRVTC